MKETANGLPYPEDTDSPDGPAQIKALADALDVLKWGSRNLKPTVGVVGCSADLNLTNAYQDVPGTELKITPAVASTLLVVASFNFIFETVDGNYRAQGTMRLDSTDQEGRVANAGGLIKASIDTPVHGMQVYALALTAAAHTLKMRAKYDVRETGGNIRIQDLGTAFLYALVAS